MNDWRFIVDLIEWVWTFVAAIGIGVSLWALLDSYTDRRLLRAATDYQHLGAREVIVRINLRGGQASLLLHTFFFVLGFSALRTANPPLTASYAIFASGFIIVALANVLAIGLNQVDRVRLRQKL